MQSTVHHQGLGLRLQQATSRRWRHVPRVAAVDVSTAQQQSVGRARSEPPQQNSGQPQNVVATTSAAPTCLAKVIKAHAATVTSALVLKDLPDAKSIVTASLDKTLLRMRLTQPSSELNGHYGNGNSNGATYSSSSSSSMDSMDTVSGQVNRHLHLTRLPAPGGPVFSIVKQPKPAAGSIFDPNAKVLYAGNASKEVVAWEIKPWRPEEGPCEANFQTVATDYTGWVRAMALMGKWLISCGCNYLLVHDTSYPIPQEVCKRQLFKGDIQAIAISSSHVYAASADGALRAWTISKLGVLQPAGEVITAHNNRICGLAVHGGTLYSVGFDGWLKAWDADSLQLLAAVPDAHQGLKVHAITVGPDGLLYTGGDDKLIRCWRPLSPALDFLAKLEHKSGQKGPTPLVDLPPVGTPLQGHESSVRVLAAGSQELLVSADLEGDVCIWALPPRQSL